MSPIVQAVAGASRKRARAHNGGYSPCARQAALVQVKSGGHKALLLLRLRVDACILLLLPSRLRVAWKGTDVPLWPRLGIGLDPGLGGTAVCRSPLPSL